MKRRFSTLSALLALVLLAGCSLVLLAGCNLPGRPVAQATPEPTATAAQPPAATPSPSPTSLPTDTATPKPTATWVPTVTPRPTPTATPATQLWDAMDAIEAEMEGLRGLGLTAPLTRTLMTRQELAAYMEDELAKEYTPQEVEADVRVLAALDFVPQDFDLWQVIVDLYSSEVLGLYDDEVNTFYIVTNGKFDLMNQLTVAHEYVHGLQDEHFDLETFVDEDELNDDQILARMALVEGDATLVMSEYLMAHLDELTLDDLASLQEEGDDAAINAAPAIIRETFAFPYIAGLDFVSPIQAQGWDAVNQAFADPPQSTEQVLHPEKYLSRDEPQVVALPPLTDTLGAGWELVYAETLGEFQTNLYLVQQVDQETADLASQGWDGDRYAVYINGDAELLVLDTVWDGPADREEFVAAYRQYANAKYGQPPTRSTEETLWWETADQTAILTWSGDRALILLGPDPEIVARVLAIVWP